MCYETQSQAIKTPTAIYCSGQIPLTAEGTLIEGTIAEKTKKCCENLDAVLKEAGSSISKVVKTTIFISDMAHFAVSHCYRYLLKLKTSPSHCSLFVGNERRIRKVLLSQAGTKLRCCQDAPQERRR